MAFIFWAVGGYNCAVWDLSWYKEYSLLLKSIQFETKGIWVLLVIWDEVLSLSLKGGGMHKLNEETFIKSFI